MQIIELIVNIMIKNCQRSMKDMVILISLIVTKENS